MAAPVLQMITANRLLDGEVVYWTQGQWVSDFAQGDVLEGKEAVAAAEALAQHFVANNQVVGLYSFDIRRGAQGIEPAKEREVIRARGPSVRDDLGKQAGMGPQEPQFSEAHIKTDADV